MSKKVFEAQMFAVGLEGHPYVKAYMDAYFNDKPLQLSESFDNVSIDQDKLNKLAQRAINVDVEAVYEAYNAELPDLVKATQFATIIVEGPVIDHEGEAYKKQGTGWKKYNNQSGEWEPFKGPLVNKVLLPKQHALKKQQKQNKQSVEPTPTEKPEQKATYQSDDFVKQQQRKSQMDKLGSSVDDKIAQAKNDIPDAEVPQAKDVEQTDAPEYNSIAIHDANIDRPSFGDDVKRVAGKVADKVKQKAGDAAMNAKVGAQMAADKVTGGDIIQVPQNIRDKFAALDARSKGVFLSLAKRKEDWAIMGAAAILDGKVDEIKRILGSDK